MGIVNKPDLAFAFRRPFAEQVAFFRGKLGNLVPTATWRDLWKSQHDRAFMVAGAAKADLLADLAGAVDKAIAEGETLAQFRKRFKQIVTDRGWHGWTGEGTKGGVAWRTRVIYETNLLTSYSAGRLAQLKAGGYKYWMYRHSDSVRHPRPHHQALNGVVRPADDPFWQTHYPPNGWGCRCRAVGVDGPASAKRLGGDMDKPLPDGWDAIDPKTGEPVGIDKGWGYMPGGTADSMGGLIPRMADTPPAGRPVLPPICGRPGTADHADGCPGPLPPPRLLDKRLILPEGRNETYYMDAFLDAFGATRKAGAMFIDATGERLLISDALFMDRQKTALAGKPVYKTMKRGRERWLLVLADTVKHPQEIWEQWEWVGAREWMGAREAMALRRRYVVAWAQQNGVQPGLSVFEWAPKRWWSGVTTFPPEPGNTDYLNQVRAGIRRFKA